MFVPVMYVVRCDKTWSLETDPVDLENKVNTSSEQVLSVWHL